MLYSVLGTKVAQLLEDAVMHDDQLPMTTEECVRMWGALGSFKPLAYVRTEMEGGQLVRVQFADVSMHEVMLSPCRLLTVHDAAHNPNAGMTRFEITGYVALQCPHPTRWTHVLLWRAICRELNVPANTESTKLAILRVYGWCALKTLFHPRTWMIRE